MQAFKPGIDQENKGNKAENHPVTTQALTHKWLSQAKKNNGINHNAAKSAKWYKSRYFA